MRFTFVTGRTFTIVCQGCGETKTAGSEPYRSAASGKLVQPDRVYADLDGEAFKAYYCEGCAAKHAQGTDTSRSVSQYFIDTSGKVAEHGVS